VLPFVVFGLALIVIVGGIGFLRALHPLLVDANDVVGFKFIRNRAVSNASDHGGHSVAKLHEVFRADWIIETLAKGNVAELDTVKARVRGHTESMRK